MPFVKGQSGNPGGRKPMDPTIKRALEAACPDAVKTLVDIMRDKSAPPKDRIACAQTVLDRVHGKPAQTVDMTVTRNVAQLSDEELLAIIQQAEERTGTANGSATTH